jgi:hypothetical protein
MAFRNIFELGECDVFVRWNDVNEDTSRGTTLLININDLPTNPSTNGYIGTVQVVGNQVVCNFDYDIVGISGHYPTIVVVPKFDYVSAIGARITEVDFSGPEAPGGNRYVGLVGRITQAGASSGIMQYDITLGTSEVSTEPMTEDPGGATFSATVPDPLPAQVGANQLPCIGVDYEFIGT